MEFHTKRRILRDVARDLHLSLGEGFAQYPIDLYVGLHVQMVERQPGRLTIGMQTEHFGLTENWMREESIPFDVMLNNFRNCDFIIDFTERNREFYPALGSRPDGRFLFGPYVFPQHKPILKNNDNDRVVFVGNLRDAPHLVERSVRLERYRTRLNLETISGKFRRRLEAALREYSFMANIHRLNGVYTELPRFLKSYLNGMVLVSEALDAPFIAGRHYADIDQPLPSHAAQAQIMQNIHDDLADYRLAPLVEALHREWSQGAGRG